MKTAVLGFPDGLGGKSSGSRRAVFNQLLQQLDTAQVLSIGLTDQTKYLVCSQRQDPEHQTGHYLRRASYPYHPSTELIF